MFTLYDIQQRIRQEIFLPVKEIAPNKNSQIHTIATDILYILELYLALSSETPVYNLTWLETQVKALANAAPQVFQKILSVLQTIIKEATSKERPNTGLFLTEGIIEPQYNLFCKCVFRDELENARQMLNADTTNPFKISSSTIDESIEFISLPDTDPNDIVTNIEELMKIVNHISICLPKQPVVRLSKLTASALAKFQANIALSEFSRSFAVLSRCILDWIQYKNISGWGDPISLFLISFQKSTISYFCESLSMPNDFKELANSLNPLANTNARINLVDNIEDWICVHLINNISIVRYLMQHLHEAAMLSLFNTLVLLYQLSTGVPDQKPVFIKKRETVDIRRISFTPTLAVLAVTIDIHASTQEPNSTPVLMSVNYHLHFKFMPPSEKMNISFSELRVIFSGPAKEKCHTFFLQAIVQDVAQLSALEKQAQPQWLYIDGKKGASRSWREH